MTWLQRYRFRHYVKNSIWIPPVAGMLTALIATRLLHAIDKSAGWETTIDPDTTRTVLGTMASAMFTFIVFVSSALLVAVQLASAQLSPRVIAIVFNDPVTRYSLSIFVFTFTLSLAALVRVTAAAPLLTTTLAAYGCLANLGVFLYLVEHVGKSLRPSGTLQSVAVLGRAVIDNVYPDRFNESPEALVRSADVGPGEPSATVASSVDGTVLAFDIEGLVSLAGSAGCVIEMVPQVGDHISAGDPLFRIYGGRAPVPSAALWNSVAVGPERTLQQDPSFVFRIMVDIASKGLSPAINDPTTAVLAIDQIHHLLRIVGGRHLETGCVPDAAGRLRLVYRTPDWEDFVYLAVTEIRQFGAESIQVVRRLKAMLEDLIRRLPEPRSQLLRRELERLHKSADRFFIDAEDRAFADISDLQGVGGSSDPSRSGRQIEETPAPTGEVTSP